MGIKSRRENILQQVQLATGLNGCQPARKSQTHLCSSVGHQMGPGLVFWAGVIWGGWAGLERGWLLQPGMLTPRLHSFIFIPVFLACFISWRSGPSWDVGQAGATSELTARHHSFLSAGSVPSFFPQIPRDTHLLPLRSPGAPPRRELQSPACIKGAEYHQPSVFSSTAAHLIPQWIRTIPAPRASRLHPGVLLSPASGWHRDG